MGSWVGEEERRWIRGDESGLEMLGRVLLRENDKKKKRYYSSVLLSPLQSVPLRPGNVIEIIGPSPSAKSHLLLQASINCILPKEWNGVKYGGLENMVMFVDLDCRFDVLRLAQLLKRRIIEESGSRSSALFEQRDTSFLNCELNDPDVQYDKDLFAACMRRFLYIRCYGTSEFLATLKTLQYQLRKEETHATDIQFLMIDSIGAFYWTDRASASLASTGNNRRTHSLQVVYETIVQEIRKLMLVHPMLVLASKSASLVDKYPENEAKRISRMKSTYSSSDMRSSSCKLPYREYMPSVWQSLVTHRVLVRASEISNQHKDQPVYLSQWLLPSPCLSEKFTVTDAGVCTVI